MIRYECPECKARLSWREYDDSAVTLAEPTQYEPGVYGTECPSCHLVIDEAFAELNLCDQCEAPTDDDTCEPCNQQLEGYYEQEEAA